MRHVSKTHRVSLDWLFNRIHFDHKIQIRFIDTKHQMADILTKGHFTLDEWNNLLCLFNISHFITLCCAKSLSLLGCITVRMAKRMQEQSEENRIAAKPRTVRLRREAQGYSKPQVDSLDYQGDLMQAQIKVPIPTRRRVLKVWQRDAQLFISTGKLVATEYEGYSGNPEIPEGSEEIQKPKSQIWPHHFHYSPDNVPHMEEVFSIVRKIYDREPTDNLKDFDVNPAIWGIFMSVTLQAALHFGRDYSLNLRSVQNRSSKPVQHFFRTTEKLIQEQTEITGLCTMNWNQPLWWEFSLLCDRFGAMFGWHQSRTSSSLERQN